MAHKSNKTGKKAAQGSTSKQVTSSKKGSTTTDYIRKEKDYGFAYDGGGHNHMTMAQGARLYIHPFR